MLEENNQMLNIVPVAPEDKLEKNIEFGFEHELFEAEKIEQNNSFDNINSALIKTYGKKVFKLNPYKDLNPVSIENVNIQLNDSNGFLSGEVKAKVLDETLNDRCNFIKTPLINDIIVDYEADKEGCQKRYDYTIELLKNENNKELRDAQAVEYQDIHSSAEEIGLQDLEETSPLEEELEPVELEASDQVEEDIKIQDLEEAKQLAEEIAEQRNELENKISDFDEVQTYISNDIETSPILDEATTIESKNEEEPELFSGLDSIKPEDIVFEFPKFEEDVIDIRYQLEKTSVNYYVFDKYREKPVIQEKVELIEETVPENDNMVQLEPIIDISDMVQETSTKFYEEKERKLKEAIRRQREEEIRKEIERLAEEIRIEQERQEEARRIEAEKQAELRRKEKEELENKIVDDILNSIEESFKIDEAKRIAEECDLRIPSDVYILSAQNFIPLPDEPTPEMKAKMQRDLIGIENHLEDLPLIIFRDNDEEEVDNTEELANSYEQALEQYEEPEYYIAPLQDFNLDDTLGRVEESTSFENESVDLGDQEKEYSQKSRSGDISYEDIEEAFFNIKTVNETVAEVEKEANELGLFNSNDSGISLAKAAKVEALVEKKKAERKIKLAEERLQAELEKQQLEEKIKEIQNKINLVKQMNLADFENEEIIEDIKPVETPKQEPVQAEVIAAAAIPKVETTIELPVKRGRGRPAGSKNKKTLLKEAREKRKLEKLGLTEMPVVKRKRGRPLGSKNKKK